MFCASQFPPQLVAALAAYLDDQFSDYPILFLSEESLIACYARVDIEVRFVPDCKTLENAGNGPNCFVAPSLVTALGFISAVEALRQQSATPYLQLQTGHGLRSAGNSPCMCRSAKTCGGTVA